MRVRSAFAIIVSISIAASVSAGSFAGAAQARESTEPPETAAVAASPTCASTAESTTQPDATESSAVQSIVAAESTAPATATQPEWQTLGIVDVDGASFTLSDFVGCPVFVANFATWCGECREQLGDTQQAAAELYGEAIFIALSVETDISPDDVAAYAEDNGFSDIRFAVMSPEMLGAMVDAFGNSAINPSSTPHVFIAADGIPGELLTGFETPDAIIEALRAVA